jgi:hypothetical protein
VDPDRHGQVVPPAALCRGRLGEDSQVIESVNAETQRAVYLAWCQEHGVDPAEQILG